MNKLTSLAQAAALVHDGDALALGGMTLYRRPVAFVRTLLQREPPGYAAQGGYRIYEADIRVGLAWAHMAAGDRPAAQAEAERAHQMSVQMGYHWGRVDAGEVLPAVENTDAQD